ncbi:MAG TPA: hypothetical protein VNB28_05290, partial [Methylomirabilota bacterium]|nr:hypothetical protein [Methylomirabilota bacterium]
MSADRDPWLLTPGPLTTSRTVKEAMLHDWGSRDRRFIEINAEIRRRLVELAGAAATHATVPVQGSFGVRQFVFDTGAEGSAVYADFADSAGLVAAGS